MKKLILTLFTSTLLFLSLFTGCNVDIVDSNYDPAPNIKTSSKTVTIGFPKIANTTKAISIYRYDAADGTPKNTDTGTIIGVVYPQQFKGSEVYMFSDDYGETGKKYYYRVRYYNSKDEIIYTLWSKETEFKAGLGLSYTLGLADNTITYNTDDSNLKLGAAVDWNAASKTGSEKSAFDTTYYLALSCNRKGTTDVVGAILAPLLPEQASSVQSIPLRNIIPSEFFDNEISVVGLIAVETQINEEGEVETYRYTLPSKLTGVSGKIICPSNIGPDVIDYL